MAIDDPLSRIRDKCMPKPILAWAQVPQRVIKERHYYRDYSAFNKEAYLNYIDLINWSSISNGDTPSDLNTLTARVTDILTSVINKHAPIKLASHSKNKQLTKPWIMNGILKSIKMKQKMYYTHFYSNNTIKMCAYKTFANKLNVIKNKSKMMYYKSNFEMCKNNLRVLGN